MTDNDDLVQALLDAATDTENRDGYLMGFAATRIKALEQDWVRDIARSALANSQTPPMARQAPMTDLPERLRKMALIYSTHEKWVEEVSLLHEAADRIEEVEAKLEQDDLDD